MHDFEIDRKKSIFCFTSWSKMRTAFQRLLSAYFLAMTCVWNYFIYAYQLLCPSGLQREEIRSSLVSAWFSISYRTWKLIRKTPRDIDWIKQPEYYKWRSYSARSVGYALLWLRTSLQTYKLRTSLQTHKLRTSLQTYKLRTSLQTHKLRTSLQTYKLRTSLQTYKLLSEELPLHSLWHLKC